jgi:predicted nuclease of predicted toxin-antitoxin system
MKSCGALRKRELALLLKLLVDECILDKRLSQKLRDAGHDLITVEDAQLKRKADHAVFEAAIAEDRMVITINCSDFVELSDARLKKDGSHPVILLVYLHNDLSKEMSRDQIVKAIANLEATGVDLRNGCHKLNDYNY